MRVTAALIFILSNSFAHANGIDACELLNPQAEVVEKLEADIRGSASTLLKLGTAGGNATVSIEKEVKNIFSNHSDANTTVIRSKLIYFYCTVIQSSDELSDAQKLHEIRKLYSDPDNLSPPDASIEKLIGLGFSFSMKGCSQTGDSISCDLSVINQGEMTRLTLDQNSFLIDSNSEQYAVKSIDFGATTGKKFPSKTLISGISVPIRMTFKGVRSHGAMVPFLKLKIQNPSTYKRDELDFKNIVLSN